MMDKIEQSQREICQKYGAEYVPLDFNLKVNVSDDFFSGKVPLNGFRRPPDGDTSGWYLWAGEEMPEAEDYFKQMRATRLIGMSRHILHCLGLPTGWRFLFAGGYEHAWFDETLLES